MFPRIVLPILLSLLPSWSWARVRTVEVKKDQIVNVKTALGVATIIQVPDRPTSLVVGDQTAFKVEYLDQAITINPLHGGARSNLYIYTDYRRFNVRFHANGQILWASNTTGRNCSATTCAAYFTSTGNFVLTQNGQTYWSTNTSGLDLLLRLQAVSPAVSIISVNGPIRWQ